MNRYTTLDAAILERLAVHSTGLRLGLFVNGKVSSEIWRLKEASGREGFRILDGRLQALRRAGKIKFDSKTGWSLVEAA